jgi:16S rRNA processing protein RimM
MKREECFELGYVLRPHGIRGDVYVQFDVDDPETYKTLESVFVEINNDLVPFFIERIRVTAKGVLISFEDCNDLESAEALKSRKLMLPLGNLPALRKDQFYYHDVIGYQVVDERLGALGHVVRFYDRQGQDLMAMRYRSREVLIPVAGEIIGRADHSRKELYVVLPEGLIDIYL